MFIYIHTYMYIDIIILSRYKLTNVNIYVHIFMSDDED
jgi:hypothetical protein